MTLLRQIFRINFFYIYFLPRLYEIFMQIYSQKMNKNPIYCAYCTALPQ